MILVFSFSPFLGFPCCHCRLLLAVLPSAIELQSCETKAQSYTIYQNKDIYWLYLHV